MEKEEVVGDFMKRMEADPDMSSAVAAIHTLINFMKVNTAETLSGLRAQLKDCIDWLIHTDSMVTSISSGCELFLRFITLASLEHSNFQECKKILIERGELFLSKVAKARQKIARLGNPFIQDGCTILTHSFSRVVLSVLEEAAASKKRFNVYVTESCPDKSGYIMANKLKEAGIPVTVILDAAAGYVMEKVDMVLVGAEGVVESGGIINKIGTYQIGVCTKAANKPFYVVSESFKFVRYYPLNQEDVPNEFRYRASTLRNKTDLQDEHPLTDYTPPAFITLIFTDLGVLTPTAISDELIKLYL
ncbi:translation initiation factor eIF2B subunit alpha-like [Ptychodera flava]|uniref:translation initiation factor eIF2B subunit alpha-like n=1 Tax=Ptychodera flava TaxID=63121 RepID=UPI00396A437C